MDGALAHLRVVDYSDSLAGQYCARLFADFGASVVLVEPPGGSSLRLREPMGQAGESLQFFHLNHGKQSLMIDRAAPADAQRFAMLLRGADIAVLPADADADAVSAATPIASSCNRAPSGRTGRAPIGRGRKSCCRRCRG